MGGGGGGGTAGELAGPEPGLGHLQDTHTRHAVQGLGGGGGGAYFSIFNTYQSLGFGFQGRQSLTGGRCERGRGGQTPSESPGGIFGCGQVKKRPG